MQAAIPDQHASQLDQPQEVGAVLVVADQQGAALGEPSQRAPVRQHMPPFVGIRRNSRELAAIRACG